MSSYCMQNEHAERLIYMQKYIKLDKEVMKTK